MKTKISFEIIFVSLLLTFILFGCKKDRTIYFDESEPLALAPDVEWALVTEPYVAFRNEASWNSDVIGHARKSEIYMVIGKSINLDENWFRFEEGWLPSNSIMIYTNRYKAETASKELK